MFHSEKNILCGGWKTCWPSREADESEVTQSCPNLVTPWTVAYQAPPSMEFSRQEYWSGLPFPSAGNLPNPGIKPTSLTLQVILYQLIHQESPRKLEWVGYPFFQHIFLTQESNWDLMHCRYILYQLSYQGCPNSSVSLQQKSIFQILELD